MLILQVKSKNTANIEVYNNKLMCTKLIHVASNSVSV